MRKAEPGSANQVPLWDPALLEVKFSNHGSARAQHAMHWRDRQAGRISFQQESTRPTLASGEYQKQICHLPECDPLLVSAEKEIIPARNGLRSDFPRVASGFGFGEGKCGYCLPLSQFFQPLGLLRLRSPAQYCQSGHAMHRQQTTDG